jgi:hypothetical protein
VRKPANTQQQRELILAPEKAPEANVEQFQGVWQAYVYAIEGRYPVSAEAKD